MSLAIQFSRSRYSTVAAATAATVCLAGLCLAGDRTSIVPALLLIGLLAMASRGGVARHGASVLLLARRGAAGLLLASVMVENAFAAAGDGTTVDPTAPLALLGTARSAAATSNLSTTSFTTTGNNVIGLICIAGGVVGVGTALISGYQLYNNVHMGEQARGSNMGYLVALVLGSLLSIIALIVGVVTTYATGTTV